MRHPFDGIVVPESGKDEQAVPTTRRAALEKMLCATAGLLGLHAVAGAQTVTTEAINEEGALQPAQPATRALNENGLRPTTLAVGEEGGMTKALNENGITTEAKNEEGGVAPKPPQSVDATPEQLKAAWNDLANTDPAKGYQALMTIYSAKQGVTFLKDNLKAEAIPMDAQRIGQLIKELDDDTFAVREKATQELIKMGPGALPLLDKEMSKVASVEVRMRLTMVAEKMKALPAVLQVARALDVLVFLATPEAKGLLETLSKGNADAWLTALAKTALGRLAVKPPVPQPLKELKER
jgi:hypothetical protein